MAGIIALLNDYQLSIGKKPALLPQAEALQRRPRGSQYCLNDITFSFNPARGTDRFPATVGCDPLRPARLLSLWFRRSLTLSFVGLRSRDAGF